MALIWTPGSWARALASWHMLQAAHVGHCDLTPDSQRRGQNVTRRPSVVSNTTHDSQRRGTGQLPVQAPCVWLCCAAGVLVHMLRLLG